MIAVLDYGLGNTGSLINAFDKLGIAAMKTADPEWLDKADGLVFPGDGAAGQAMENLKKRKLINPVKEFVKSGKPFLGICLGMQILLSFSEEGNTKCLDIISGKVKKFKNGLKIPQIGWNQIQYQKSNIPGLARHGAGKNQKYNAKFKNLFKNIPDKSYFYFINSYYCVPDDKEVVVGTTDYGSDFCSVFVKSNMIGLQFHPERSGEKGLRLLNNFSEIL